MADAREVIAPALREAQELRLGYAGTTTLIRTALAEAGLAVVPRDAAMAALLAAEAAVEREHPRRDRFIYRTIAKRYNRDMEPLRRLRAALASAEGKRDG